MRRFPVGWVAALVGTCVAAAEPGSVTVGFAVVPIAPGWVRTRSEGPVVLKPVDLPAGVDCSLTLAGGSPLEGPLLDRLAAEWKGFEGAGRVSTDDGGKIDGVGNPVEIASRSGSIETPEGSTLYVWLLLAHANARAEIMIFIATSPEAWARYGAAASAMVNGATFTAPKPAGALAGVCFGFAQVKTQAVPECWIFLPDGVVYHGFPVGGPAHLDPVRERERNPARFGRYSTEDQATVARFEAEKDPVRFVPSEGAWASTVTRKSSDRRFMGRGSWNTWTEDVEAALRIAPVGSCDGLRLSGTYRLDALDLAYAPKAIPSIRFTTDGGFSEDGLVHEVDPGTELPGGASRPTTMPAEGGHGSYSIAGNTLELRYQDGPALGLTFLARAEELASGTPQVVYLHRSGLVRVP